MIDCGDLRFQYSGDAFALEIPELIVVDGEKAALVGPSGSGKTTLMQLIAGILIPSAGRLEVAGEKPAELSLAARQSFRIQHIGMVPQNFDLLDYLTVEENILLPYRVSDALRLDKEATDRCREFADRVGISELLDRMPGKLSQGERQRVAICRGLVTRPRLILADEPTGNLDPENQERIVALLLEQATAIGATVLMITHDRGLLPHFERVIDILEIRSKRKGEQP